MIDTHAHLNSFDNLTEMINNMEDDGLEYIVNIGTTMKDSRQGIKFAEKFEKVYTTVGIYPEYSIGVKESDLVELEKLAKHSKVVAIGEIGLDYHRDGFDKESQKALFLKQLELADRLGLPFCVHCRGAAEDVYELLSQNKQLIKYGGLMHCYSEGSAWAEKFLGLGMYISLSGNITYKKSDMEFLKTLPLDKILVETDAPYLTPEPFRGRRNEPKNVRFTLERVAKEIGVSFEELEKITTENARRFYFKIKD